jgi:hypothetical protein
MNAVFDPPSEPYWPSVGIRKTDFRPHFDGDLINLYSVVSPQSALLDSEKLFLEATRAIAQWILQHKNEFGLHDRFQIILGWPSDIRHSSRQVIKTGGDYIDIRNISESMTVSFRKGWSLGIHPYSTEQGAAANP